MFGSYAGLAGDWNVLKWLFIILVLKHQTPLLVKRLLRQTHFVFFTLINIRICGPYFKQILTLFRGFIEIFVISFFIFVPTLKYLRILLRFENCYAFMITLFCNNSANVVDGWNCGHFL